MTKIINKQKNRYLSVNKKAFHINDQLSFELFVKKEKKMNLYSELKHIVTKSNTREFFEMEKIFINSAGIDNYKEFINLKKERLKRKKIVPTNDVKVPESKENRAKYFSVNKKSFNVDQQLKFELFVKNDNKINIFSEIGHIINIDNMRYFEKIDKIFINSAGIESYKELIAIKQEKLKVQKRSHNIEFVVSDIKDALLDIYSGSSSPDDIQKLYPLATNLTRLIIGKKSKQKNLMDMISKNYHTETHSLNVSIYAAVLGRAIGLSNKDLNNLILSGMLHDIGKTEIPEKILNKPAELNEREFREIKTHTTLGFMLARKAGISNTKILSGIHHHHERLDGSGYPNGFKNDHVSQFARIIGICDMYDAMSTNRVFQDSKKNFVALMEIKKTTKGKLDSDLIDVFIKSLTS